MQSPRHRAKGEVCLGVRRRPAEDGGVGAPPPAGRAERRQHLDLILIRVLPPGQFPQDRADNLRANDLPLETVANRSAPMGCGPNVDQAWRGARVARSCPVAAIEAVFQLKWCRTIGVWPRGAQVRWITGSSEAPDSSQNTMAAWRRRAFARMLGPVLGHPAGDGPLVALHRTAGGTQQAVAQPVA
jgi:hypothetical protein